MFIRKLIIPKQLNGRKIRIEISKFVLLFIALLITVSCQKREWDNPFDPDCPKEFFTPSAFKAEQQGNLVKLSWIQTNTNISGFKLERKIPGESWVEIASVEKSITTWNDDNLSGGKLHEYRLYALAGSNQSNKVTTQITPIFFATITTIIATNITSKTALCGGKITNDGGASVSSRGVCWNTTGNPTIEDSKTTDGSGNGDFTSNMTNLATNTTFHVRAYALNNAGIAYGNEIIFTTFYGEVTDIDGNVYLTIKIGNQVWMAENLKVTKYNDGTPIPNITDNSNWAGLTSGAYCFYNNDISNKSIYGALYNWHAVYTNKLAPSGWHVPTDEEWTIMTTYLGEENTGGKLKEAGTEHWLIPNSFATNETRFTGLPGGHVSQSGFVYLGKYGYWWCWTDGISTGPWFRALNFDNGGITKYAFDQKVGLSVRCIQGVLTKPVISTTSISQITTTTAISGGNIASDGGASITSRGVCWNTTGNPTISDAKTSDGGGIGSFTSSITGLTSNTTYFVRAYATNSQGTAYGSHVSFTTSPSGNPTGSFIDSRDGKTYKTVKIGGQTFMAENLAYLPAVNPSNTFSFTGYKYYVYGYEGTNVAEAKATSNYINFGVLYNWISAVQGSAGSNSVPSGVKGICPDGWHLPSIGEWNNFKQYLIDNGYGYGGSGPYIAKSLAAKTGWSASLTDGTPGFEPEKNNSSGFSALAGGIIVYHLFNWQNNSAFWWSATNYSSTPETSAVYVRVDFNSPSFPSYGTDKSDAFSVRCIKD